MYKTIKNILILFLIFTITGCNNLKEISDENTSEISLMENKEFQEFTAKYPVQNPESYDMRLVGYGSQGLKIFQIYNKELEKTPFEIDSDTHYIYGESTKEFGETDLFVYYKDEIYPLEFSIDRAYVNPVEIAMIIEDEFKIKKIVEVPKQENTFGEQLVARLFDKGLIHNMFKLSEEKTQLSLGISASDYSWINMITSDNEGQVNELIVVGFENEEQKLKILEGINYRKTVYLNNENVSPHVVNAFSSEFLLVNSDFIVYAVFVQDFERIKDEIGFFVRK